MVKSPLGIALGAAALLLALSPEARREARKWTVKATECVLDLSERVRETAGTSMDKLQSAADNAESKSVDRV